MSADVQNSRSQQLSELVVLGQPDTQSQNDFRALKRESQNITLDSGQPTVSGTNTKASKHDMSGTDFNPVNKSTTNLSQSDFFGPPTKSLATIPKATVQLNLNSDESPCY